MDRRSFLTGLGAAALAAPAIVRYASIMPVRGIIEPAVRYYPPGLMIFESNPKVAGWMLEHLFLRVAQAENEARRIAGIDHGYFSAEQWPALLPSPS